MNILQSCRVGVLIFDRYSKWEWVKKFYGDSGGMCIFYCYFGKTYCKRGLTLVMETGPLLGGWSDPGQGWSGPGLIQGSAVRSGSAIQLFKSVFQNGSKSKKKKKFECWIMKEKIGKI